MQIAQSTSGAVHPATGVASNKFIGLDVTPYAMSALLFGQVHMDPEAFGVTVTRRIDASINSLTGYERARLLDVLQSARRAQLECDESPKTFTVFTISSDARDAQARNYWLTIERAPHGVYQIALSDL